MPRPRVTKPTIASGGTGLQHRASCVISRSTPTKRIPLAPGAALLFFVTSVSSGTGWTGSGPRTATCSARGPISSRPTAAKKSSALAKPNCAASVSSLTLVAPSRAISRSTSARPAAIVRASSSALNHCRTLFRARELAR